MNAIEYLKEKARMTNNCDTCRNCPLDIENNEENLTCVNLESNDPVKAVEIVEKWAKENPVKTYLSVLLEKFPNVPLDSQGIPKAFCPENICGGYEWEHCNGIIDNKCTKCWNREYKEEE